jgi:2-iminoacetate synthase ThiH
MATWSAADLLLLGAIADIARSDDSGDTVSIHELAGAHGGDVTWVQPVKGASELDVLRAVAVARIAGARSARIGIDWSQCGMELAQVALGFGASDLRGPVTRKSGLPIYEDETKKVKGQGMVELRSIRKREIAALVTHAGRLPVFVDDDEAPRARESVREVASNV